MLCHINALTVDAVYLFCFFYGSIVLSSEEIIFTAHRQSIDLLVTVTVTQILPEANNHSHQQASK